MLPKVKKEKKEKSISQLKSLADKLCSEYIRRKYANWKGEVACYTCGKTFHWKQIQNGHYISRVYSNTRYYEPNLRPQCYSCNVMRHGAMDEFAIRLERETPGILKELNDWKHRPSSTNSRQDLLMVIDDFKSKLKLLHEN